MTEEQRSHRSDRHSDLIGDLVERFEVLWEMDEPPNVATFMADPSILSFDLTLRQQLLVELVCVDLEHRWRKFGAQEQETVTVPPGIASIAEPVPRRPRLEDYLRRFPDIGQADAVPLDLIVNEFRARHYWGDRPRIAGFVYRFGKRDGLLENSLRHVLSEVTPLSLRVYFRKQLVFATQLTNTVEVGRQQQGERAPFCEVDSDVGTRLIIAAGGERKISRRHLRFERTQPTTIHVSSLTTKGDIGVGTARLAPGCNIEVEVPVLLVLGQHALRVESGCGDERTS